jgi:AcrR family transcriptional regulator
LRTIPRSIPARAVSARAGYTTGAFYNYWPNQDAFVDDLVHHVFNRDVDWIEEHLADIGDRYASEPVVATVVASAIGVIQAALEQEYLNELFFWTRAGDVLIRDLFLAQLRRFLAIEARTLERYLDPVGIRPRIGLDWSDVARQILVYSDGAAINYRLDADWFRLREYVLGLTALFLALTTADPALASLEALTDRSVAVIENTPIVPR